MISRTPNENMLFACLAIKIRYKRESVYERSEIEEIPRTSERM
jgi:hypothetical protein